MQTDNRAKDQSQTLARGLRLLEMVTSTKEGAGVRDLAAAMQLPRSIVQRLLYTLEAEGFLERDAARRSYRASMKLWSLGSTAVRRLNVLEVARPLLEELAGKSNEMVKLAVLDGCHVVYIDGIESPQAVRAYVPIGGRAPVHCSATGKAILAFLSAEKLAEIGPSNRRHTSNTVTGAEAFAKELEQIRKRGYAINRGEWSADVGAVAAPLFDVQGAAFGSAGVILPLNRLTAAKAAQMGAWVSAAARQISARLGHQTTGRRLGMKRVG